MAKVNDFASELTRRYGLSPEDADGFITMMFDVISEELDAPDKQVKVKGLGTFKVTSVGARASVDVNTGERIVLEGRNKISFTPEAMLRDRVNRPFAQFETVVLNDGVDFSEIDREFDESRKAENGSADGGGSADAADDDIAESADEEIDAEADYGQDDLNVAEADGEKESATEAAVSDDAAKSETGAMQDTDAERETDANLPPDTEPLPDAVPMSDAEPLSGVEPQDEGESNTCEEADAAVADVAVETPICESAADGNTDAIAQAATVETVGDVEAVDTGDFAGADEPADSGEPMNLDKPEATDGPTDGGVAVDGNESVDSDEVIGRDEVAAADEPAGDDGSSMVCKQRNPRVMYWLTAASFALLVCIGIGMYFLYRQMEAKNEAIEQLQSRLAVHAEKTKSAAALPAKSASAQQKEKAKPTAERLPDAKPAAENAEATNTVAKAASAENGMPKTAAAPVEKKPTAEKKTTPKDVKTAATATSDYSKDVRIRTGAYVIVGTETVVTVRKGQTLASISKANLGPGMECYVEAYNNVKTVKVGDKLKIPKLKLKKRNQ